MRSTAPPAWVQGWKRNGWKNSQKKPVKNADLIRAIDNEIAHRAGSVRFVWVKGHAGNAGNEKVDELARTYAGDCRSHVREGYLPLEGWQSLLASEYSRGTDVPEDARMLMDGAISAAEYHMGRGQGDSATTGTGDSGADTANSSNSTKPRSIASMLAEPEGVSQTLRISDRQPMTTQMMRWKRPCSRPNRRKPPQCLRPKRRRSYLNPASRTRAVQPNRTNPENRTNPGKRTNPVNRINPMRRCWSKTQLFSP